MSDATRPVSSGQPAGSLLDTDVVSFLLKGDTRAERYRPHLQGRLLAISFMTVAELLYGMLARNWGEVRRRRLHEQLRRLVVHPYDATLCQRWAEVTDERRRAGHPIGVADAWIAATAVHHDVPLITHNAADYTGISRLRIISEPDQ
jgi:tRNA(fMet)-specific endonuclease VapC